ncbi:unnamed protein product, partial [Mesorhabditis spiculigera]
MWVTFAPETSNFSPGIPDPCPANVHVDYEDARNFVYAYAYDCAYAIQWEGMQMGALGLLVCLIALGYLVRSKKLNYGGKVLHIGYLLCCVYTHLNYFYRIDCILRFDPAQAVNNHTYNSFPCLNVDGYPFCGFMLNIISTSLVDSLNYTHYAMIFIAPVNRFIELGSTLKWKKYLLVTRPILQVFLLIVLPALPFYAMIGRALFFAIAPHTLAFILLFIMIRKTGVKSLKSALTPRNGDYVLQQMLISQLLLFLVWLIQSAYGLFYYHPPTAIMEQFVFQMAGPVLLTIGNPIILIYFYWSNAGTGLART